MVIIGVTGGIGTGKSTVSGMLAELGAEVLSADAVVHELLSTNRDLRDNLVREFGVAIIDDEGDIDRTKLGRVVFANPDLRRQLESILHPLVRSRISEWLQVETEISSAQVLVLEIPLLFESGWSGFDAIVVVEADDPSADQRAAAALGIDVEHVRQRRASQMSGVEKAAKADFVVSNKGSMGDLFTAVAELWQKLLALPPRPAQSAFPGPLS